jgi:hypothetical protein
MWDFRLGRWDEALRRGGCEWLTVSDWAMYVHVLLGTVAPSCYATCVLDQRHQPTSLLALARLLVLRLVLRLGKACVLVTCQTRPVMSC